MGAGIDNTLFLHHFDAPIGSPPANADYAAGSSGVVVAGGVITSTAPKFGDGAYDVTTTGRAHYVSNDGNFNFAQGTVEFWINKPTAWNDFAYKGFFGVHAAGVADFRVYKDGNNRLGFYAHGSPSSNIFGMEGVLATPLSSNEWHHIAVVWDSSSNYKQIFVDGVAPAEIVGFGGAVNAVSGTYPAQMTIGAVQSGSAGGGHFYDEFRISDVVRYNGNFTPPIAAFVVPEPATLSVIALSGLLMRRRHD